jgi:hypothetical protein
MTEENDAPAAPATPHHDPHRCPCGAAILWAAKLELDEDPTSPTRGQWVRVRRDNGKGFKSMPIDFTPNPLKGNVVIFERAGQGIVARVFRDAEAAGAAFPAAPRRTSHFATCPNAKSYRKSKGSRR